MNIFYSVCSKNKKTHTHNKRERETVNVREKESLISLFSLLAKLQTMWQLVLNADGAQWQQS